MAADPVSRPFQLQIRHIAFAAQIPHLEELKRNDSSFNRTGVQLSIEIWNQITSAKPRRVCWNHAKPTHPITSEIAN